jgi:myosin-5
MTATFDKILANLIKGDDKHQFGKTNIFFQAGQVAYLKKLHADRLRHCCIIIQKQVRAFIFRKKYLRTVKTIRCIQHWARDYIAR